MFSEAPEGQNSCGSEVHSNRSLAEQQSNLYEPDTNLFGFPKQQGQDSDCDLPKCELNDSKSSAALPKIRELKNPESLQVERTNYIVGGTYSCYGGGIGYVVGGTYSCYGGGFGFVVGGTYVCR